MSTNSAMSLDDAFLEWATNRKDLADYRNSQLPYPVLFVSSEGGGIYAAAHAYGALSTLSAHCPTFLQHTFALVGVSGGAIGNALFASEAPTTQHADAPCSPTEAAALLSPAPLPLTVDHLSPVLARLLFVEFVDRLSPLRWLVRDRAQILADSFLSVASDKAFLQRSQVDAFDTKSARPAVVAVATNVADGRRFVISPFAPDSFLGGTAQWWPGKFYSEGNEKRKVDVSVIDAAGVSARFPWITPTGLVTGEEAEEFLLADGGYFDNSGADTVLDIVGALKSRYGLWRDMEERSISPQQQEKTETRSGLAEPAQAEDKKNDDPAAIAECTEHIRIVDSFGEKEAWEKCEIRVFLIHFAIASDDAPPANDDDKERPEITPFVGHQSFLLDPVATLLATRQSRSEIALSRSEFQLCSFAMGGAMCSGNPKGSVGFFRNDIRPLEWALPLGWYLPTTLYDTILERSIDKSIFHYRETTEESPTLMEKMILHFDRALYEPGASPSAGDKIGAP